MPVIRHEYAGILKYIAEHKSLHIHVVQNGGRGGTCLRIIEYARTPVCGDESRCFVMQIPVVVVQAEVPTRRGGRMLAAYAN